MMMPPQASVLLLLLPAVLPAAAQQPATPSPQNSSQPTATITVKAHLVLLDVVVTDKHGQPVHGLKQSDFQLSEDGVPHTLASFTTATAPTPDSTQQSANARKLISYSPKGDPDGYGAAKRTPLESAMSFGAVAPFPILFQAHVTPELSTEKIKRNMQPPKGNYLNPQWLHSPCRNYHIHYSIDPQGIQFVSQRVGFYYATIQFVAIVYDDTGQQVNSLIETVPIEVDPEGFGRIMQNGMGVDQTIAVPTHGNFFLRLGVHDLNSDHIGTLEVPVETIKLVPPQNNSTTAIQAH